MRQGRVIGAVLVVAAVATAVLFGRELAYELGGGGTPGKLAVEHCDTVTERDHRPGGGSRTKWHYRCLGTFTGEDGTVAPGVQVDTSAQEEPGAAIPVERVHGDSYEMASKRTPSSFVSALGIAAVLFALGVYGLLTGFAQRRHSSLRSVGQALPAPKVVGPLLAFVAVSGVVTVIVSSVL